MRVILGTLAVAAAVCLVGPAGAATSTTNATIFNKTETPAGTIIVAQRCRCVERRWNGSCKRRICKDRW
jgi:hypothetical protein